jgi:NAD(P)H-nitrite reductase large subunit
VNYLIVGNSAGAVGAIEAIRAIDADGLITLVAAEGEHTYSRPLISYLLAGKVDASDMDYRPSDFYEQHRVETILGDAVTAVDPGARTVTTAAGRTLPYDRLLLATGGTPIVPPIAGADADGVFTFTTYDDARQMDALLDRESVRQAVVLGGGMIGLKAAEALIARGLKVTIVELADRLLANTFDLTASAMLVAALEARGAAVCLETTLDEVTISQGHVRGVRLSSGLELYCRIVVVAIGVQPNVALLEGSGIETGRGIVVDQRMQTSAADVYAAGDVAEAYDLLLRRKRPIPILPLAYRQGMIAGRNMAGAEEVYTGGMPMNAIEICDLPTISVGITHVTDGEGYEILARHDAEAGTYRKVVLKDNRLVGVILVGDIDRAGIVTGLIERREDVSAIKHLLLENEFGLLLLDPEYRKHMVSGPGIEV